MPRVARQRIDAASQQGTDGRPRCFSERDGRSDRHHARRREIIKRLRQQPRVAQAHPQPGDAPADRRQDQRERLAGRTKLGCNFGAQAHGQKRYPNGAGIADTLGKACRQQTGQ